MNYSSRFFLYAPLGLFLALAVFVGIQWWLAASALSARLQAMNGREIAPGVTMRYASRTISGFPFNLDTVFRDVAFRITTPHGPTEWRSEHFAMHALTYGRDETIFEAAGRQELHWTRDDGSVSDLVFAVGSLHASAIEDSRGLARFDLDLMGFGSERLTAQRLQFHIRHGKDDKLYLAVMTDGLRIAPERCPNLDGGIAAGRLTGTIAAADAFSSLRAGTQDWSTAIMNWRATGGMFRIETLSLTPLGGKSPTDHAQSILRLHTALEHSPADKVFALSDMLDAVCGQPASSY